MKSPATKANGKPGQSACETHQGRGWLLRAVSAGRLWAVWSIMMVAAAALLRWQFLQGLGTNAPYITFYPAVVIAALYGGLRAGFLTLSLSAAVGIYFWVEPVHTFTVKNPADWLLLVTFLTTTALISFVTEAMHRARARAHAAVQREAAALAQREADERLRFALEQSQTGGWDLDLADHTAIRTLKHDQIFGYESLLPEWTYEKFLEHVLPEDRAEVDRRFRAATATQSDWNIECRIRRKDGAVRWIWATGGHQRDADGQARRMAGIVQDITERKQAAVVLAASEKRHRAIFDGSPVPLAVNDDQQNITYLNRAFGAAFGYTRADLPTLADWWLKAYPDPQYRKIVADAWNARLEQAQQTGNPFEPLEAEVRCKDGTIKTILADAAPLAEGNYAGEHLAVLYDITERKQAEAVLRKKAEALRASNAELEQFNRAMIGRELRMIELKQEINELCRRLGEPPRHETAQLQPASVPAAGSPPAPPGGGGV